MKLYSYWRSSASWRVRIGLHLKNIAFEYVPVNLAGDQHKNSYRDLNAMGQVPTLEIAHEGKQVFLAQSLAILEFLDERFPSPAILPTDPILRARARQLAEIINSAIQPFQNLTTHAYIREHFHGDENAWTTYFIARGLAGYEAAVKDLAGDFSIGPFPTLADICLIPQLTTSRRFGLSLEPYPTLLRIEANCLALPAFIKALPEHQPDAPRH